MTQQEQRPSLISRAKTNQVLAPLVLLILILFFLSQVLGVQQDRGHDGNPPSISFSVTGSTTSVPDAIKISATATTLNKSSSTTLAKLSSVSDSMRKVLTNNSIKAEDISSANLSLYPEYSYTATETRTLLGYRASQNFEIQIKNVESAGTVIDQLVGATANQVQINSISSFVLDPTAALKVARKDAMNKAKAKADEYAKLTGMRLGKVLSISENLNDSVVQPLAMAKDVGSTSFDLGSTSLGVSLSVTYEIK
jgi:uncharacterized protein YggE